MIPKVVFIYSRPYDWNICMARKMPFDLKRHEKEVSSFVKKVEKKWRPIEKKVLKEAAKFAGAGWEVPVVICYVPKYNLYVPFSHPLTIGMIKPIGRKYKVSDYIDTLVHELLHGLLSPRNKRTAEAVGKFMLKYKNERLKTRTHILLHAVHKHLYLKFFGEKRLEKDIKNCQRRPEYGRAWEIVEAEGYKNIIAKFRKYLK